MFFPREMTEIELVVPSKDLLAVTRILSRYGVFHQTDSNYPGVDTGSASSWQEQAAGYAALERRVQAIMQTLGFPEAGHGALIFSQCAKDIGLAFVERPDAALSTRCIETLKPKWVLPTE